nr:MAG TPA: hypothetical protein [Microviridae sp.]
MAAIVPIKIYVKNAFIILLIIWSFIFISIPKLY